MTNPREAYYGRAESWADDTRFEAARSRRIAWTVAGVAVAVALFEAVALALLTPLKTVQPVTLLVDRHTGYVQALDPTTPRRVGADEALTRSLLAQYVVARERFDRGMVRADYRRVALWSAGRTRQAYLVEMPATNPASPFRRFPAGTGVQAVVKSISSLERGVALVRFDTQLQDGGGRLGTPQPWISVVRYRFTDAPMQFEDRLVNPLGFQVVGYRRDAEAPTPAVATPVQPVAVPAPPATSVVTTTTVIGPETRPPQRLPSATYRPPAPQRQAPRPTSPTTNQASPGRSSGERREVPIGNVPLGSPLSPGGSATLANTRPVQ